MDGVLHRMDINLSNPVYAIVFRLRFVLRVVARLNVVCGTTFSILGDDPQNGPHQGAAGARLLRSRGYEVVGDA